VSTVDDPTAIKRLAFASDRDPAIQLRPVTVLRASAAAVLSEIEALVFEGASPEPLFDWRYARPRQVWFLFALAVLIG
jgi:hypothetical protein